MKLLPKGAILATIGVLLLGTGLALSSTRVSGATQVQPAGATHVQPSKKHKACDTTGYCLEESNGDESSGGGIYAGGYYALVTKSTGSNGEGYPFYAEGASSNYYAYIDAGGNAVFTGEVVALSGFYTSLGTRDGVRVASVALAPRYD